MFKNLFSSRKDKGGTSTSKAESPADVPHSSFFSMSLPSQILPNEFLKQHGRLICRVLLQVMRRDGVDASEFQFLVEYANPERRTFRVMTNMPADVQLSHLKCREYEHTAMIELEMRHEIELVSVFWRIKEAGETVALLSGFSPLAELGLVPPKAGSTAKRAYPPPVKINGTAPPKTRVMAPLKMASKVIEDDGLTVSSERDATPSELAEFHDALRVASESTDIAPKNGHDANQT